MSCNKTLIGKNGYLFLINDSSNEIQRHVNEESIIQIESLNRYDTVLNKFFIVVFPDKSYVCKSQMPDGYDIKYRPHIETYKNKFGNYLFDGYEIIGDDIETFYKTDSHMNLKGTVQIYYEFVKKINSIFKLNLIEKIITIEVRHVDNLCEIEGYGDLTWWFNIGDQQLYDKTDFYYYSNDLINLYPSKLITHEHDLNFLKIEDNELKSLNFSVIGTPFNWSVVSNYIIHKKNKSEPNHVVLIFYDSFLISTLFLYLELFDEVYMCKDLFNTDIVNVINPDYVFEFRVERFLS